MLNLKIDNTLNELNQSTTLITVTHKLSSIINYDSILVMDKGSIIDAGNHTFLLKNTVYKTYEIETFKKMDNIEHIGIAVSDPDEANEEHQITEPNRTNRTCKSGRSNFFKNRQYKNRTSAGVSENNAISNFIKRRRNSSYCI